MKRNRNCYKKHVKKQVKIKAIFERNEPTAKSHTITHSPDLQNDLQASPEIIQPEETTNYYHHDNVPNENNREHIKNSKYLNASFIGIPEKNQPKYIDFQKLFLENLADPLFQNGTRNSLGCVII